MAHRFARTAGLLCVTIALPVVIGASGGEIASAATPPASAARPSARAPTATATPSPRPATARPAQREKLAPLGSGGAAVLLELEQRRIVVRGCAALPCSAAGGEVTPISIPDAIDAASSEVSVVSLAGGGGARIARVLARSATRPAVAWEALVAPVAGGGARVVWSGGTGPGADGEGAGGRVRTDGGEVFVGRLRRELTICGQPETLLEPRRLDAPTMTLRPVAMERLSRAARDAAQTIHATVDTAGAAPPDPNPVGSVLGIRGASTNDGEAAALVDGDLATAWVEARRGDGRGEFAVFSASRRTPIERLSLVVRPSTPRARFTQATELWVVTDDATFRVTVPVVDTPGARADVVFPAPLTTSCLAIALEHADPRGADVAAGDPAVGLAEVEGVPVLPATVRSLEDVVTLLDGAPDDAALATAVLSHAGAHGARAVVERIGRLGDAGRERAVDVLESLACADAAVGLARLAWDAPPSTAKMARRALDACRGEATGAVADAFARGPIAAREALALRYARLDPAGALGAITGLLPTAKAAHRRTLRSALGVMASTDAGRRAVVGWLATEPAHRALADADPVIELGRAIAHGDDLAASGSSSTELVSMLARALIARAPTASGAGFAAPFSFDRAYLAAAPIAALARRGDARAVEWTAALLSSPDRYLRARAAAVSGAVEAVRPRVVALLDDADPRVREHAIESLKSAAATGVGDRVGALLANDRWTFVRVAAVEFLATTREAGGAGGERGRIDAALAAATHDGARVVRAGAVRGLAARGARSQLSAVRSRAFDPDEDLEVRREGVEALGTLCDAESTEDLTELAKRGGGDEGERVLALAAIRALGALHPRDLAERFSRIDRSSLVVRDALDRAVRTKPLCETIVSSETKR